jgi:hypothetical protein
VGTDELAAREEFGDLSGVCGSGDVVVFGIAIEEEVTDGATGEVGEVAVLVEAVNDFEDVWGEDHEGGESLEGGRGGGKAGFSVDAFGERVGEK